MHGFVLTVQDQRAHLHFPLATQAMGEYECGKSEEAVH